MEYSHSCRLSIAVLMLLLLSPVAVLAAFERQAWGGAVASTGGSHAIVFDEPWAALEHPALASLQAAPALSIALHPGAFGLVELRRTGLAAAIPFRWGGVAGSATAYGFELYRELTLALAAAVRVLESVRLGAGLRFQHLTISGYGSIVASSLDASLRIELSEAIASTATVSGLLASSISSDGERPPRELRFGFSARILKRLRAGIEWTGDRWYPMGFAAGMELQLASSLALRCGLSTEPPEYTLGLGVRLGRISVDYGVALHALLGSSHALSVGILLT